MSNKVDPRVKRTKNLFESALLDLMMEKEFEKISVQEIAAKSTLNRATFYLHYYDKYELLTDFLDNEMEDLKNSLRVCAMEFQYQYDLPHPSLIRLFEQMMKKEKFYKVMLAEKKVPYFTDQVNEILEAFVIDGVKYLENDGVKFNTPVDIRIPYTTSAYLGVMIWWLKNDMPYTPTYMAKQLTVISTVGSFEKNPFLEKEVSTSQTVL